MTPMPDPISPNALQLAPGVWIPAALVGVTASRSGGAGGQHVNKTASRVELRLPVAAICGLNYAMRLRLNMLAGSRLTAEGELLLVCDETRSRRRNEDMGLERLRELVREAQAVPRPRRATKPTRGSVQRRLHGKAATSERKQARRGGQHDD